MLKSFNAKMASAFLLVSSIVTPLANVPVANAEKTLSNGAVCIEGTVVSVIAEDEFGKRVEGVSYSLLDKNNKVIDTRETKEDGIAYFIVRGTDDHFIDVAELPENFKTATVYGGEKGETKSDKIQIKKDFYKEQEFVVDYSLDYERNTFNIQVVDHEGNGVEGLELSYNPLIDVSDGKNLVTDKNGQVKLDVLVHEEVVTLAQENKKDNYYSKFDINSGMQEYSKTFNFEKEKLFENSNEEDLKIELKYSEGIANLTEDSKLSIYKLPKGLDKNDEEISLKVSSEEVFNNQNNKLYTIDYDSIIVQYDRIETGETFNTPIDSEFMLPYGTYNKSIKLPNNILLENGNSILATLSSSETNAVNAYLAENYNQHIAELKNNYGNLGIISEAKLSNSNGYTKINELNSEFDFVQNFKIDGKTTVNSDFRVITDLGAIETEEESIVNKHKVSVTPKVNVKYYIEQDNGKLVETQLPEEFSENYTVEISSGEAIKGTFGAKDFYEFYTVADKFTMSYKINNNELGHKYVFNGSELDKKGTFAVENVVLPIDKNLDVYNVNSNTYELQIIKKKPENKTFVANIQPEFVSYKTTFEGDKRKLGSNMPITSDLKLGLEGKTLTQGNVTKIEKEYSVYDGETNKKEIYTNITINPEKYKNTKISYDKHIVNSENFKKNVNYTLEGIEGEEKIQQVTYEIVFPFVNSNIKPNIDFDSECNTELTTEQKQVCERVHLNNIYQITSKYYVNLVDSVHDDGEITLYVIKNGNLVDLKGNILIKDITNCDVPKYNYDLTCDYIIETTGNGYSVYDKYGVPLSVNSIGEIIDAEGNVIGGSIYYCLAINLVDDKDEDAEDLEVIDNGTPNPSKPSKPSDNNNTGNKPDNNNTGNKPVNNDKDNNNNIVNNNNKKPNNNLSNKPNNNGSGTPNIIYPDTWYDGIYEDEDGESTNNGSSNSKPKYDKNGKVLPQTGSESNGLVITLGLLMLVISAGLGGVVLYRTRKEENK